MVTEALSYVGCAGGGDLGVAVASPAALDDGLPDPDESALLLLLLLLLLRPCAARPPPIAAATTKTSVTRRP